MEYVTIIAWLVGCYGCYKIGHTRGFIQAAEEFENRLNSLSERINSRCRDPYDRVSLDYSRAKDLL